MSRRIPAAGGDPANAPRILTAQEQRIIDILDNLTVSSVNSCLEALEATLKIQETSQTMH